VIEAAEELNDLLGPPPSLVSVDTPQVRMSAVKRAEDSDAVIVRVYEAWGRPCRARITTSVPHSRVAVCDLLERETEDGSLELDLGPFQVVTLKLEPGQA
jgi:alpha-mannosidase